MNAIAQNWNKGFPYVFPASSMVSREVPLQSNCQYKLFPGLVYWSLFKTIYYIFVLWAVKQNLDFIKEKFTDNDQLSKKETTLRVTTRLGSRTSRMIFSTCFGLKLHQ